MFIIYYLLVVFTAITDSLNILAIFPHNGVSHDIFFSSVIQELALKNHEVTVINCFPITKNYSNIRQILLQDSSEQHDLNITELYETMPYYFRDLYIARIYKSMANDNCRKLMKNKDIFNLLKVGHKYDLVIVEQFVTDCGFALAHAFKAPTVGMSAHILMPWTYSRLGAPNNPAVTPNHIFGSGTNLNFWTRMKSAFINFYYECYYKYIIQKSDYEIVKTVLPETPDLEELAKNMSLILINQYFPFTGSRIYGPNVIEVGGLHVKKRNLTDKVMFNHLKLNLDDDSYIKGM